MPQVSEQKIFPLHEIGGLSPYYTSEIEVKNILSKGCVMCHEDFSSRFEILLHYETSTLHVIGLTIIEVAELRIIFHAKHSSFEKDIFIVDRKAAVCLKCWTEFLKQIVKLKGKDHGS